MGETLTASVVVRNDSTHTFDKVHINIDIVFATKKFKTVHRSEVEKLRPGGHEIKVSLPLTEEGDHSLCTHVTFSVGGTQKRLTIDPSFTVRRLLTIDQNVVRALPGVDPVAERVGLVPCVALDNAVCHSTAQYLASFALSAKTSASLRLTDLVFEPSAESKVKLIEGPSLNAIRINEGKPVPADSPVPIHPSEVIRVLVRVDGPPRLPPNTDIGTVRWAWQRGPVDGPNYNGTDSFSLRIPSAVSTGGEGFVVTIPTIYPPQPTVGSPVTITLSIKKDDPQGTSLNTATSLSLAVHLTKLLPSFLYSGPILIPIGLIKPSEEIRKNIVLIPVTTGMVSLAGAFDLRDTASPQTIVWPLFPRAVGGSVPVRGVVPVSSIPPEYPPRLIDMMVYPPMGEEDDDL